MGFVVGKLGSAPDGSRVAIELTGPLARTIRVDVDGAAQVVDDSAGWTRRRRSAWTGCCSPGWPADAPTPATRRMSIFGGDRGGRPRVVEHLNS